MMSHPALLFGIGAVALPLASGAQQPLRYQEFVTPDSVRIHYVVRGSGPPLVLLHGFALSADLNWVAPGALDSLATTFTVIVPDLRGHGHSDKPHDPAAYGRHFVDDVLSLLDHLRIARAHVAGYSMGGTIALKLVTTHPDRVRSAVLGGSGWQPPGAAPRPFIVEWITNLERAAREHTSVAAALRRPDTPVPSARVMAALDRNDPSALGAILRSAAALAVTEPDVRALTVPIHAVVGELDAGARAQIDALARLAPQLTVTIIPGAHHGAAMSDPRLAAAIRTFARGREGG